MEKEKKYTDKIFFKQNQSVIAVKIGIPLLIMGILILPLFGLFKNWTIPIYQYGAMAAIGLILMILVTSLKWSKDSLRYRMEHPKETNFMNTVFSYNIYMIAFSVFLAGSSITMAYLPYDTYTEKNFDKVEKIRTVDNPNITLSDIFVQKENPRSIKNYSLGSLQKMNVTSGSAFFAYIKEEKKSESTKHILQYSYKKVITCISNKVDKITIYQTKVPFYLGNIRDDNYYDLYILPLRDFQ